MNPYTTLSAFCQDLITDINKRISPSGDDNESSVLLYTYESKVKAVLTEIEAKENKSGKDFLIKILRDISQLVLDVTYVKEIQLVEDEFSPQSSESDVKYIIDSLIGLEVLTKNIFPEDDVKTCLGAEILECLRWRKGALLYMFCHTIYHKHPDQGIPHDQLHHLGDGVAYLVSMLKTRCNAKWLDTCNDRELHKGFDADTDTLQLIEQGVFSDTHLLALMYCGEMCYWHTLASGKSHQNDGVEKDQTKIGKQISKNECAESTTSITMTRTKSPKNTAVETSDVIDNDFKPSATIIDCSGDVANLKGLETAAESSSSSRNVSSMKSDMSDTAGDCVSGSTSVIDVSNLHQKEANLIKIGNSCLKKYLSVAQGVLASAGWSTDQAIDIINHFQSLKL